ncbi:unnamed protein product [Mucor hiemalis]
MKRSSTSDFKKNKKLCLSTTSQTNSNSNSDSDNDGDTTSCKNDSNNTNNNINLNNNKSSDHKDDNCTISKETTKMTTTLDQIKDMILRLDKGDSIIVLHAH